MQTQNNLNKAALERNFKIFPISSLIGNLTFFGAYLVVLFKGRGLSMTEITMVEALFGISVMALEIPTGALADRWSRRGSVLLGIGFWLLAMIGLSFSHEFWHFAISEFVAAVGMSLMSGAENAVQYDTLKVLGREEEYDLLRRRLYKYTMAGAIIALPMASVMAEYDPWITVYACIPVVFAQLLCYSFITEPPRHLRVSYAETICRALNFILRNPQIRNYVIFTTFVGCSCHLGFWSSNPYWLHISLPLFWFGITMMGLNIVSLGTGEVAARLEKGLGRYGTAIFLSIIGPLSFLLMGHSRWIWGAIVFQSGFQIQRGFINVVVNTYIDSRAQEEFRATASSVVSMIRRMSQAVMLLGLGHGLDNYGFITTMSGMALAFTLFGIIGLMLVLKSR